MPLVEDPRHNLRLPIELKKKLSHAAVDSGRSMNAEILARLEASFAPETTREIETLLRSFATLADDERSKALALLVEALAILSKR
jgi:plasmid stability protein